MARELVVEIQARGGDDDNVSVFDIADGNLRHEPHRIRTGDGLAIKGSDGDAEARLGWFTFQCVPEPAGAVEHLDGSDGG